jgi:hypothetical protein
MLELLPGLPEEWQDTQHNPVKYRCSYCKQPYWARRTHFYLMEAPEAIKVGLSNQPCERLAQNRVTYGLDFKLIFVSDARMPGAEPYRSEWWFEIAMINRIPGGNEVKYGASRRNVLETLKDVCMLGELDWLNEETLK